MEKNIFDPSLLTRQYDLCLASFFLHEFPPHKAYKVFEILLSIVRKEGYLAIVDFFGEFNKRWQLISAMLSPFEPLPNRLTMISVLPFLKQDARVRLVYSQKLLAGLVAVEILQKIK